MRPKIGAASEHHKHIPPRIPQRLQNCEQTALQPEQELAIGPTLVASFGHMYESTSASDQSD
jgi:hypothetical protein